MGEHDITPLRHAFELAREANDMSGVLPVFLRTDPIWVAAAQEGDRLDLFITPSPIPDRYCVTIAERREFLDRIPAHLVHATDVATLLARMIGRWDVVILYAGGGDVLHAEYVPDLREMLGDGTPAGR